MSNEGKILPEGLEEKEIQDGSTGTASPSPAGSPEAFARVAEVAREAAYAAENVEKLNRLFAYPAADESKDRERLTFVEVGGGSTHARIYSLTRAEIEILDTALKTILYARHATSRTKMARLAAELTPKASATNGSRPNSPSLSHPSPSSEERQ